MPAKKKSSKKKTAKKKTAKKKTAKKKTATKKTAKKKTAKKKTATKKAAKTKTSTKKKTSAKKKTSTKTSAKKKTSKKRSKTKAGVVPWADRYKRDAPGPWTCPKCGSIPRRLNPFYGEDERHHCPMDGCDAIVTLLSKEDLEPKERRGSWPPQRNKGKKKRRRE